MFVGIIRGKRSKSILFEYNYTVHEEVFCAFYKVAISSAVSPVQMVMA